MSEHKEKAEQPFSVEEQKAMLEGSDPNAMPAIPAAAIIMEDEKPEQFKEMMDAGSSNDKIIMAINEIPQQVIDAMKDE